ncbi:DNA internalization-related competence protein ComEC/Rec2 [soil metagenome]
MTGGGAWWWLRAYPLAAAAVAAATGILLAPWIAGSPSSVPLLLAVTLGAAAGGIFDGQRRWMVLVAVAGGYALHHGQLLQSAGREPVPNGSALEVSGRVISTPSPGFGDTIILRVEADGGSVAGIPGYDLAGYRFEVVASESDDAIGFGSRVRVSGRCRTSRAPANPGGFDLEGYLERNHLNGRIRADDRDGLVALGHPWYPDLGAVSRRCRDTLAGMLTRGIADRPAACALLKAMVLGMRDDAPPELEETFRLSGTMHLFAISGLHVGIFSSILWAVLRLCMVRRSTAIVVLIASAFAYAFVTGWRPPAVRAALMMAVFLGAVYIHRPSRFFNSLGCAALIILAYDTSQLSSPGFQLSFGVLAALALLTPVISKPILPMVQPDSFIPATLLSRRVRWSSVVGRAAVGLFCGSLAAWLGSMPLIAIHFGLVTPLAVLANCLLLPVAFGILAVSGASVGLGSLGMVSLALAANRLNAALAGVTIATAGVFADSPGGHFRIHSRPPHWEDGAATITVLATGGGAGCQVIAPPAGAGAWLVDTSTTFGYRSAVRPYLQHRAVPAISGVVITHADAHHAGGAGQLAEEFRIGRLVLGPGSEASPVVKALLESGLVPSPELATRGFGVDAGGGLEMTVLAPASARTDGLADDRCAVLRVGQHGWRVLLMGDAGFETERELLESGEDLRCDILVKGSHGSDISGTLEFIRAAAPAVVVASNAHFPEGEMLSPDWIAAVRAAGITLFDQSVTGAVSVVLARGRLVATPFLGGAPVILEAPEP